MYRSPSPSPSSQESSPSSAAGVKYRGVRKRKWGKYVSEIRLPNSRERIWLGSYDTAEQAARAFDAALYCLRGRSAKFNFPDTPPEIDNGRSMSPAEIQVAAAHFAYADSGAQAESDLVGASESRSGSFEGEITEMSLVDNYSTCFDGANGFMELGSFSEFDSYWDRPMTPSLLPPAGFPENHEHVFSSASFPENDEHVFSSGSSFLWNF